MREHRFLGSSRCLYISRVRERQSSHALEEELGGTRQAGVARPAAASSCPACSRPLLQVWGPLGLRQCGVPGQAMTTKGRR